MLTRAKLRAHIKSLSIARRGYSFPCFCSDATTNKAKDFSGATVGTIKVRTCFFIVIVCAYLLLLKITSATTKEVFLHQAVTCTGSWPSNKNERNVACIHLSAQTNQADPGAPRVVVVKNFFKTQLQTAIFQLIEQKV